MNLLCMITQVKSAKRHWVMILRKFDCTGVNFIKVLHLYFTRVAIVCLTENNNCTCKLQVLNFYKIDPRLSAHQYE